MNITRQINNRKIGKSPSQLGEQSIPIYGDKATACSQKVSDGERSAI